MRSRFLHLFRLSLRRLGRDAALPVRQFGEALNDSFELLAQRLTVFRRSVNHSPEWFFVTTTGFVGIGLTTLMFFALTADRFQWLGTVGGGRSVEEAREYWARVDAQSRPWLDTRDPLFLPGPQAQYLVEVDRDDAPRYVREPAGDFAFSPPTTAPDSGRQPVASDWPELPPLRESPRQPAPETAQFEWDIRFERVAPTPVPVPDQPPVTATARSAFPDLLRQVRLREVVGGWSRSSGSFDSGPVIPVAYVDRRDLPPQPARSIDRSIGGPADQVLDHSIPSSVDVGLDLALLGPIRGLAHLVQESYLKITNRGSDSLPRLQVIEPLDLLETVVDARPLAEVADGTLRREIVGLNSGSERQLSVRWVPREPGRYRHEVTVIAEALVAAETEVGSPQPKGQPLLAISARKLSAAVRVDETLEIEIEVRNEGDAAARNVAVYADVSPMFDHRYGRELEYRIGDLPAGGSHRTVLRLTGRQTGEGLVSLQAMAAAAVPAATRIQSSIQPRPAEARQPVTTTAGRQPLPEGAPRRASPPRENSPIVAKQQVSGGSEPRQTPAPSPLGDVCRCCPSIILSTPACILPPLSH